MIKKLMLLLIYLKLQQRSMMF